MDINIKKMNKINIVLISIISYNMKQRDKRDTCFNSGIDDEKVAVDSAVGNGDAGVCRIGGGGDFRAAHGGAA